MMADERGYVALGALDTEESAVVRRIDVAGRTRRRLIEMGLTPGTRVTVTRRAPLGDPIEISLRGYALTLREDDALGIMVSKEGATA